MCSAWIWICITTRLIFNHISYFWFYCVIKKLCNFHLLCQVFFISWSHIIDSCKNELDFMPLTLLYFTFLMIKMSMPYLQKLRERVHPLNINDTRIIYVCFHNEVGVQSIIKTRFCVILLFIIKKLTVFTGGRGGSKTQQVYWLREDHKKAIFALSIVTQNSKGIIV